jgi:hypothetical protein
MKNRFCSLSVVLGFSFYLRRSVRTYFGLSYLLCVVRLDLVSVVAAGSSSAAVLFLPLQAFSSVGLRFSVQHQAQTGAQFHLPLK